MKEHLSRRRFIGATAAALATPIVASGSATAHSRGSSLYTTSDLNVRDGPGLENGVIATATKYTGMYIEDGPVDEDGYRWWYVRTCGDGDNGRFKGWAVQKYTDHADVSYPATGYISSDYYDSRSYGYHSAVDIANNTGTSIKAARGGTVNTAAYGSSCGYYIKISHDNGYETLYCHLNDIDVSEGQSVSRYEHIGSMGETGHATGPHVHFEVNRNGDEVYVAGDGGEEVYARTGVPKNYSGL